VTGQGRSGEAFDAVIIGAGITGVHQLYRLRRLGLAVRVLDAAPAVGGTWYWNRYPGARFDSESYTYGYSFSDELLHEWNWSERYAAQPEVERYINRVVDKFQLRGDIQLDTRVESAHYDEASNIWYLSTSAGELVSARYLLTAVGILSAPQMPSNVQGLDTYKGEWYHTGLWPEEDVSFQGKRVAVIGTGASGIQVITEVAKSASELTVFQRTAIYAVPMRNLALDDAALAVIKSTYPEIFESCNKSPAGFEYRYDSRLGADVSASERHARYEELWAAPGFGKWLLGFPDIATDESLNAEYSDFVRAKIRARVSDPVLADRLTPAFRFGTRRIPLEDGYFEVYNQPNVELVDLRATPIVEFTPTGVACGGRHIDVDLIVFATGFDAFTGALDRIDIKGTSGVSLRDKWSDGPKTNLGLQVAGFPNLFTLVGPHNKAALCNVPRCSEQNVEWVTDCIGYMLRHGYSRIQTTADAEAEWTRHVHEVYAKTLLAKYPTNSLWLGSNTPGKTKTVYGYMGPFPDYRARCDAVASSGYRGFVLD
jgi:cation diffusion facilitator CzcD-associated flavoprotein CzcO